MCITLKSQKKGICIDCGLPHERVSTSWRCWDCSRIVYGFRAGFSKLLSKAMEKSEYIRHLVIQDKLEQQRIWAARNQLFALGGASATDTENYEVGRQ